ncbi:MAG: protein kinase [Acidobacteriota bacterium]
MDAERWQRVDAILQAALARQVEERTAYLDATCAGDAALRREVESVLAAQAEAGEFLETPAWQPAEFTFTSGTRLGPYQIESTAGAGGMGEVYKARDTRLNRIVAIKVLPPELASDPDRRRRFEHEAQAVAALKHPHICPLHDIGDAVPAYPDSPLPRRSRAAARSAESGGPVHVSYLVMEHLDGQTLAARLKKGPLPVAHVLDLGAQMADALSAAHKASIVHRDLKPANVMLTKAPAGANGPSGLHATLLDFGLAKLRPARTPGEADSAGGDPSSVTTPGMLLGTVPYMAPEQVAGRDTDARTDIWALGAVLYEMLTGARAFDGDTPTKVAAAILEHEPEPLATLHPQTPPGLARLITKCLAKDPDARGFGHARVEQNPHRSNSSRRSAGRGASKSGAIHPRPASTPSTRTPASGSRRLPRRRETDVLLSVASIWEIAIRHGLGRLRLPEPIERWVPSRIQIAQTSVLPIDGPTHCAWPAFRPCTAIRSIG